MPTAARPLTELDPSGDFPGRHIGPDAAEQATMLALLGFERRADLVGAVLPDSIRADAQLDLPAPRSEPEVLDELEAIADRNEVFTSLIGLGYSGTITPGVIQRNVLENPGWYTAYTPYQPEISQGRLEALVTFQTMVCDLTGMEIANASMLDEATAAAEAMAMCHRANPKGGSTFFIDSGCHPQTIEVCRTRADALGMEVVVGDPTGGVVGEGIFGVLLAYPTSDGTVRDDASLVAELHQRGIEVVVSADILALVLLRPPGEVGADIVVGSTQRFGVPMGFGGPHAGYLAARDSEKRSLPGRLAGVSVDAAGRLAYRLTLQTREQHIRRERATSNICTAQVLLAEMAAFYAMYHGPIGLERIARRVHRLAIVLAAGLRDGGVEVRTEVFFDTITVSVPGRAAAIARAARERRINLREIDTDHLGISLDETTGAQIVELVWEAFGVEASVAELDGALPDVLGPEVRRSSAVLAHPIFNRYHSETEMLRYLRRLMDRDLALDRAMIPLGSCTMKLNATTEMIPISWSGFAHLHPFAPIAQSQGFLEVFDRLEQALIEITGYDAVSLQPNAGSQGEFAGLLAIAAFHESRGDTDRDICLIPASAHGTNAASAAMAGMRVVVVACDDAGDVDLGDLRTKIAEAGPRLSCAMVTYPSTHGVFEEGIVELCDLVHAAGGQVYLDGANLNALVGVARPGQFGADVSHINLHKTFCIPHGGGGPGVGPIGVKAHLAPFLPNHPLVAEAGPATGPGPVSAAPWGSAGILPISLAYLMLMGPDGLRAATEVAILVANYIARRLDDHFPVLYSGTGGLVAHECILDLRPITERSGVTVDDVAKRLIDYGFHAPTMSFPVAGTLMVEATESESLAEIDRFCDAMIAIRDEIRRVESGEWSVEQSPLRHAPHPGEDVLADDWSRPVRELGAYPIDELRRDKYWVPVSRIDNAFGDRNIVCACPPIDSYR